MYVPTKEYGFQCLSDPRCVRAADYRPHPNTTLRHDSSLLRPEDVGRTPAWRVFIASYWGDRPEAYSGQGESPRLHWGQEGPWSSHLLDVRWHVVPYAYPGHTHVPLTVEQTCLSAPVVPHGQRNSSVLVLAKDSAYFFERGAPDWAALVPALKQHGLELWAAPHKGDKALPEGIRRLPPMDKAEYARTLAGVSALLGIGRPHISPSPFNSVCAGVPVLIPYYTDDGPRPGGWKTFKDKWTQHGPALQLGEPHVYAYRGTDELVAQLARAVATPFDPYVPHEMTLANVAERTREWLHADWEGRYDAIRRERRVVEYPPIMAERCYASGMCKLAILQ